MYDVGDHSDIILKTSSWLEHAEGFKIKVLYAITKKEENKEYDGLEDFMKQKEYL